MENQEKVFAEPVKQMEEMYNLKMSYEYSNSVLKEVMENLREKYDHPFTCTSKEKDVEVRGGMKVSRRSTLGSSGGWQEFLIEPRCRYYQGNYNAPGQGLRLSGGECGLEGNCTHCSREGEKIPY